jgi:NADH-quinone oxidoreductase subunit L
VPDVTWVVIENGVTIHLGLIVDQLSVIMAVVVSVVSLMVQIYSLGYMAHDDAGY